MKTKKLFAIAIALIMGISFYSCKETPSEKLEDEMESHSESLDDRSDNMEDATDYVVEGFDDIEDAIENFKNALEKVENDEDRREIRKRINKILDDVELKKKED